MFVEIEQPIDTNSEIRSQTSSSQPPKANTFDSGEGKMKSLKSLVSASLLSIAIASSALAGNISTGKNGNISTGVNGTGSVTVAGNISTGVKGDIPTSISLTEVLLGLVSLAY
jgi:hypothetical protein